MRLILGTTLLLALTACGGDDSNSADDPGETVTITESSEPADEPEEPEAPAEPVGESQQCRVAATRWADRMTDVVLDASTTAPAFAQMLEGLPVTETPASDMTALCSDAVTGPMRQANLKIYEANFELSLCAIDYVDEGWGPTCKPKSAKKIRRLADQAAGFVGQVRTAL